MVEFRDPDFPQYQYLVDRCMHVRSSIFRHFFTDVNSGVARICCEEGQRWKLSHGAIRAGCSSGLMTNSFCD